MKNSPLVLYNVYGQSSAIIAVDLVHAPRPPPPNNIIAIILLPLVILFSTGLVPK